MAGTVVRNHFSNCLNSAATSAEQIQMLWNEIEAHYTASERHYHTLAHLDQIAGELLPCKNHFHNWTTVILAVTYHDIIYDTSREDNEEQSAEFARHRLAAMAFPPEESELCVRMILATKKHETHADEEINLFTDADLSILGADAATYDLYAGNIRKEYKRHNDLEYKAGRKRVLNYFLSLDKIFKTPYFFARYEQSSRINLSHELESLG